MKKMVSILLAICMGFSLAACGGTKTSSGGAGQASQDSSGRSAKALDGQDSKDSAGQKGQDSEGAAGQAGQDLSDETAQVPDGQDSEDAGEPVETVVYGNEPNNLYQKSDAPCFGGGRAYYINSDGEVMSIALDGSDVKVVGAVGGLTRYSMSPSCLNWYKGSVYYVIVQDRENPEGRYFEIRSMDTSTGAETVVLTCEDGEYVSCNSMLIIGDNLFYSCYDVKKKNTSVNVCNLAASEQNQILKKDTGAFKNPVVFAADGRYLYMAVDGAGIFRTAWSGIYEDMPECENVTSGAIIADTIIFTEDGFYSVILNDDSSRDYVFYPFEDSAADWPCEIIAKNVPDGNPESADEDRTKALVYSANNWMIEGAYAAHDYGKLFYSPSADFTQAAAVGDLEHDDSETIHEGTYQGVLYLIIEGENSQSLHTLTADGTYK